MIAKNSLILAPMAAVSETPFRYIAKAMGASAAPTELVSPKGIIQGSPRAQRFITPYADEGNTPQNPFWVQFFGSNPEEICQAATFLMNKHPHKHFIFDLNMGCPVKKVTRKGSGSSLIKNPAVTYDIINALKNISDFPVSAKIRAGFNHLEEGFKIIETLNEAKCDFISIHGRTTLQQYTGKANWQFIEQAAANSDAKIIGNGDIFSRKTYLDKIENSNCYAFMIGRGALGNPWIFKKNLNLPIIKPLILYHFFMTIYHHLPLKMKENNIIEQLSYKSLEQKINDKISINLDIKPFKEIIFDFWQKESEYVLKSIFKFRQHWIWYLARFKNGNHTSKQLLKIKDLNHVLDIIEDFFATKPILIDPETIMFDSKKSLG